MKVRDRHLPDDRFLDAERFPTISLASERVGTVEQRDLEGGRIAAHTVLDRREFKIGPKAMGLVVSNDVAVRIALARKLA